MHTTVKKITVFCITFLLIIVSSITTATAIDNLIISPVATTPTWVAESNRSGVFFGVSVNTAGDVNGDNYDDIIVGAFGEWGYVHVYYGTPTGPSTTPNWIIQGDQWGARFGYSVSTAGD